MNIIFPEVTYLDVFKFYFFPEEIYLEVFWILFFPDEKFLDDNLVMEVYPHSYSRNIMILKQYSTEIFQKSYIFEENFSQKKNSWMFNRINLLFSWMLNTQMWLKFYCYTQKILYLDDFYFLLFRFVRRNEAQPIPNS